MVSVPIGSPDQQGSRVSLVPRQRASGDHTPTSRYHEAPKAQLLRSRSPECPRHLRPCPWLLGPFPSPAVHPASTGTVLTCSLPMRVRRPREKLGAPGCGRPLLPHRLCPFPLPPPPRVLPRTPESLPPFLPDRRLRPPQNPPIFSLVCLHLTRSFSELAIILPHIVFSNSPR